MTQVTKSFVNANTYTSTKKLDCLEILTNLGQFHNNSMRSQLFQQSVFKRDEQGSRLLRFKFFYLPSFLPLLRSKVLTNKQISFIFNYFCNLLSHYFICSAKLQKNSVVIQYLKNSGQILQEFHKNSMVALQNSV